MKKVTELDILKLEQIFEPKWRIQSVHKTKRQATCFAYFQKEMAIQILNDCLGATNWQRKYSSIQYDKDKYIVTCSIGIKINDEWLWREDAGDGGQNDDIEEKSIMTSSFKRACSAWGIGMFLNQLGFPTVQTNKSKDESKYPSDIYPVDSKYIKDNNKDGRIWDLTSHLNQSDKILSKKRSIEDNYRSRVNQLSNARFDLDDFVIKLAISDLNNCKNIEELRLIRSKYEPLEKLKIPRYIEVLKLKKDELN